MILHATETPQEVASNLRIDRIIGERDYYLSLNLDNTGCFEADDGSELAEFSYQSPVGGYVEVENTNLTTAFNISINSSDVDGFTNFTYTIPPDSVYEYSFEDTGTYNISSNGCTINVTVQQDNYDYGHISKVHITTSLGPGSEDVDLSQLIVCISDATHTANVNYHLEKKNGVYVANNTATSDYFSISPIRIRDSTTFDPTHPVLRTGDVMEMTVDVRKVFKFGGEYPDPAYTGLATRTTMSIQIRSDAGSLVLLEIITPASYFRSKYIQLLI